MSSLNTLSQSPYLQRHSLLHRTIETGRALIETTKPRLALFSILTAMAAYATVSSDNSLTAAIIALCGISLSAGGALSLNHWWERETDGLMRRTRDRPLPTNRISPSLALAWSCLLSVSGVGLLLWQFSLSAAAIAASIIVFYGLVYTPMKRRSNWATEVGSLSGAMPPLLGASAAGDIGSPTAWVLFALLLFWQMPHFYAIGWRHRADYQAAGFPLLPAIDGEGRRTARWSLGYTVCLLIASILPWATGLMGFLYGIVASAAGLYFLRASWRFYIDDANRDEHARALFIASIIYLPTILIALAIDAIL